MRKVGIMGGTFDPIHIGHLLAANAALEAAELDEVWFIPSSSPPLKPNAPIATADQRLKMVARAIADHPYFRVLDIELSRGGTSYSYDTVVTLMKQYPDCSFSYIIGSDRIHDLSQWHNARELKELVQFIGLDRPLQPLQLDSISSEWREKLTIVPMPLIDISSTMLRNRLRAGMSVRYYVPDAVEQYIRGEGIYE